MASRSHLLRKVLRYSRLYGISRTWVKIGSYSHTRRVYAKLPEMCRPADSSAHVGVIGCGKYAYGVICHYLAQMFGRVVRGAMDIDKNRAASLCEAYGLNYYTLSAEELIQDPR